MLAIISFLIFWLTGAFGFFCLDLEYTQKYHAQASQKIRDCVSKTLFALFP
jgi:hypothetical protein